MAKVLSPLGHLSLGALSPPCARRLLGLLGGLMLAHVACGLPATPTRGFRSRQILAVRDPSLSLRSFRGDATGIYLARSLATATPAKPIYNRALLDLATNQERAIQDAVTSAYILPGGTAGGLGWSLVLRHYPSDAEVPSDPTAVDTTSAPQILSFIDEATGERLDLPRVTNVSLGARRADPIMLGRYDAADIFGSWFGPPDNLVPLPKSVTSLGGFDSTGAIATMSTTDSMMAAPGNTTLSVVHLAFDGSAPTEIVPSVLADHVVVAADGAGGSDPGPAPLAQVMGYSCPRVSDGDPQPRCLLLYTRGPPDNTQQRLFVRLLDDPREVELPGVNPVSPTFSPDGRAILWGATSPDGAVNLFSWTVGADHAASCTPGYSLNLQTLWRANDDGFAVTTWKNDPSDSTQAWALATGTPGDPCQVIASGSNSIASIFLSPDGSLLGRFESRVNGDSVIHVSALDGSGDRTVAMGMGSDFRPVNFLDDRRLLVQRASGDGVGLSWLDLGADPIAEHPMADRVQFSTFNSWVWINPRWLLLGDSYSPADDTFTLAVVDVETGDERIISTAVTEFRVPWTTAPRDATELPIVYIVRGRSASAQDGVWLARLPLADFPP